MVIAVHALIIPSLQPHFYLARLNFHRLTHRQKPVAITVPLLRSCYF